MPDQARFVLLVIRCGIRLMEVIVRPVAVAVGAKEGDIRKGNSF